MNLLNRLERKLGKYAIPNLMYYVVILYAIGMFVQMFAPMFYIQYLMLDASAILRGQIWRIITFMLWPPASSLFFNLLRSTCIITWGLRWNGFGEPSGSTYISLWEF